MNKRVNLMVGLGCCGLAVLNAAVLFGGSGDWITWLAVVVCSASGLLNLGLWGLQHRGERLREETEWDCGGE